MFIINSGIPKSGTTLLVAYQNDLVRRAFPANGIAELRKHTFHGYVDVIDEAVAKTLRQVNESHGPFVVKTHREPTPATRELIESGIAKATFAYRDPRDCVLSALDHAERSRRGADPTGAFGGLRSVPDAVAFYRDCCLGNYRAWRSFGNVLLIRYEELMADKPGWLARMAEYFSVNLPAEALVEIYQEHERNKATAWNFNKGTTERWRSEMSAEQQQVCRDVFGPDLAAMGYPVQ